MGEQLTTMDAAIQNCSVSVSKTLIDAIRVIDVGGAGIALVVDEVNRLVGTLTDGDVRRVLLKGISIDSPLAPHIQRQFVSVGPETGRAEVLDLMQARLLNQVPIIDAQQMLLGMHLLHEVIGAVDRRNWAVIMAGGMGTRLRPLTEHVPKPMIKVAGRPILERLVLHLVGFGIRRVFLSINYLGNVIEEHFGDGSRFGCRIHYLRESEPLGTGGALSLLPEEPREPVLVLNGDLITQVSIDSLLRFHTAGGYRATMTLRRYVHEVPFGCAEVNDGRVITLEEKPLVERSINAGIYVLSPQVTGRIPQRCFAITDIFQDCLDRGEPVGAFKIEDEWIDVGERERLKQAREGAG